MDIEGVFFSFGCNIKLFRLGEAKKKKKKRKNKERKKEKKRKKPNINEASLSRPTDPNHKSFIIFLS